MAQNLTTDQRIYSQVAALTGGIGTGKSTAARFLEQKGAITVSADRLAREVTAPGGSAIDQIKARFGSGILAADGSLDRQKAASLIFSDPAARADLEAITHPLIRRLALDRFAAELKKNPPLLVYDCPLFFESGLDRAGFKAVIVVTAPIEAVRARLAARSMTPQQIDNRIAAQLPLEAKISRAGYLIDNSGTIEQLKTRCAELFEVLRNKI